MKNGFYSNIENLWDHLLSREPALIQAAFQSLTPQEQQDVLVHLGRMVSEAGWHPEQIVSARAALDALEPHAGKRVDPDHKE